MFEWEKRTPHIMNKKKTSASPSNFLFFDCETKSRIEPSNKHIKYEHLWFGYAIGYEYIKREKRRYKEWRFDSADEFWKIVDSRCTIHKPLYVIAHNLGFDLTIVDFWHRSEKLGLKVEYYVLDDPPTFIVAYWNDRKIVFLDTLNYWRSSLADIGKSIGLKKGEMPKTYRNQKRWNEYCKRDVEILDVAVAKLLDYIQDNSLGGFTFSQASLAMRAFRHRFMKHDIFIHDSKKVCELERGAYYGGRVECFFIGKPKDKPIYKLDVNSLYPFIMLGNFPCKWIDYHENPSTKSLQLSSPTRGYVAKVRILDENRSYPKRFRDKLCYVIGDYETYLCGEELDTAIKNRSIFSCSQLATYELKPIFTNYVNFFWKERQLAKEQKDKVKDMFCKFMLNSLYGKFGQRGYEFRELNVPNLKHYFAKEGVEFPSLYANEVFIDYDALHRRDWYPLGLDHPIKVRRIGDKVDFKFPSGEHYESFPAITAFVTANARTYLNKLLSIAGMVNVFYCDTDSIFCNSDGYKRLKNAGYLSESKLGKLKLEGKSNVVEFRNLKSYTFGSESKTKGVRKDAKPINKYKYRQNRFEGIRGVLSRGGESYITITSHIKTYSREYNKGTKTKSGHTKPIKLNGEIILPY